MKKKTVGFEILRCSEVPYDCGKKVLDSNSLWFALRHSHLKVYSTNHQVSTAFHDCNCIFFNFSDLLCNGNTYLLQILSGNILLRIFSVYCQESFHTVNTPFY